MPAAKPKKQKPPPGPDELVRQSAGSYKTGDGRFEVQKADLGWFLVDTEQANEFGQQLIHGPMSTLDAVREAVPGAREMRPLLRGKPTRAASSTRKSKEPPRPPPSWIDRLSAREAREVRRLMGALEREGLSDVEELVKRHRDDTTPTIATRVIERRLATIVDGFTDEDEREIAQRAVTQVVALLAEAGTETDRPLPRWALIDVDPDEPIPRRRLKPRA